MTIENPYIFPLQIPTQEQIKSLRRQFNGVRRKYFHEIVKDALFKASRQDRKEICDAFKRAKFEFHHIIPLSLGGTNERSNLAIVEEKLHQRIHVVINASVDSARDNVAASQGQLSPQIGARPKIPVGTEVKVSVPIYPNKIWFEAREIVRPQHKEKTGRHRWQVSVVNSLHSLRPQLGA
ncbi:MAG: HNH endonuclease signature motif containing protein [Alphaproteobacteria bacterium]